MGYNSSQGSMVLAFGFQGGSQALSHEVSISPSAFTDGKAGIQNGKCWPKVSPRALESPSVPLQPINFRQWPSPGSLFVLQQLSATSAEVGAVMLPLPTMPIPIPSSSHPCLHAFQPKQAAARRGWRSVEGTCLKPGLRETRNISRKFLNFSHWTMISVLA